MPIATMETLWCRPRSRRGRGIYTYFHACGDEKNLLRKRNIVHMTQRQAGRCMRMRTTWPMVWALRMTNFGRVIDKHWLDNRMKEAYAIFKKANKSRGLREISQRERRIH